GLQGYSPPYSF
nr:immunoglobulin light chain junction region [Macaca mulatta]